mgnify:FL=1
MILHEDNMKRKKTANPNIKCYLMDSMCIHGNIEKEIGLILVFQRTIKTVDLINENKELAKS